jgi:hypothetical protein
MRLGRTTGQRCDRSRLVGNKNPGPVAEQVKGDTKPCVVRFALDPRRLRVSGQIELDPHTPATLILVKGLSSKPIDRGVRPVQCADALPRTIESGGRIGRHEDADSHGYDRIARVATTSTRADEATNKSDGGGRTQGQPLLAVTLSTPIGRLDALAALCVRHHARKWISGGRDFGPPVGDVRVHARN